MEEEIWKDVPDFPDYQVSNLGNVLSRRTMETKLLKGTLAPYAGSKNIVCRRFTLYKPKPSKGRKDWRAHELVMFVFVGKTPKGKTIIHRNGNHLDDRLENLKFGDHPSIIKMKEVMRLHP